MRVGLGVGVSLGTEVDVLVNNAVGEELIVGAAAKSADSDSGCSSSSNKAAAMTTMAISPMHATAIFAHGRCRLCARSRW